MKKRVLLVTELFPPSVGGQEIRFKELGEVFLAKGWSVTVFTIDHIGNLPEEETLDGIKVCRLIKAPSYKERYLFFPRNPFSILSFSFKVKSMLQKMKYDFVFFNQWPLFPQIIIKPNKCLTPLRINDWCETRSGMIWSFFQKRIANSCSWHTCVSRRLRTELCEKYKLPRIEYIPSGIDLLNYDSNGKRSGVLFFGRLSNHKHPEIAAESIIALHKDGFKEKLTIAGGGPLLDVLRQKYGGLEYIDIVGKVTDEEKGKLLKKHRLHILPSEREGFPRTVAECMASGIPTITTEHPDNGTKDIVREFGCGMVVNPNINEIANAINELTTNKDKYLTLRHNCIKNARDLDWQNIYNKLIKYLKIYDG